MTRILFLTVLLLIQSGLIFWLQTPEPSNSAWLALSAQAQDADQISLTSAQGEALQFSKNAEQQWLFNQPTPYPAKNSEVDAMLLAFANKAIAPNVVATSAEAAKRFRVADTEFSFKLELKTQAQTLATVYIGNLAKRGHYYIRRAGEQAIYSAPINASFLMFAFDRWADLDHVRVSLLDIAQMTMQPLGVTIDRNPEGKVSASTLPGPAGTALHEYGALHALRVVAELSLAGVVADDAARAHVRSQDADERYQVVDHNGKSYDYQIYYYPPKLKNSEAPANGLLRVAGHDEIFKLSPQAVRALQLTMVADKIISKPAETSESSEPSNVKTPNSAIKQP